MIIPPEETLPHLCVTGPVGLWFKLFSHKSYFCSMQNICGPKVKVWQNFHIGWKVVCANWNLDDIFQYVQQQYGESAAFLFAENLLQRFYSNQCFMSRRTWEIFYIYCQIFVTFIAQLKTSKSSNSLYLTDFVIKIILRILSYCPTLWLKGQAKNNAKSDTISNIFRRPSLALNCTL